MPPPPGTAGATIEKRANITAAAAGGAAATISAKPQIINPKAEVTRFVPTALRVRRDKMAPGAAAAGPGDRGLGLGGRREEHMGGGHAQKHHAPAAMVHPAQVSAVAQPNMKTKDQVYEAFMREMEGLL